MVAQQLGFPRQYGVYFGSRFLGVNGRRRCAGAGLGLQTEAPHQLPPQSFLLVLRALPQTEPGQRLGQGVGVTGGRQCGAHVSRPG